MLSPIWRIGLTHVSQGTERDRRVKEGIHGASEHIDSGGLLRDYE